MFVNPLGIWYVIGQVGRVAPGPPKPSSLITIQMINPLRVGEWNASSSYSISMSTRRFFAHSEPDSHDKYLEASPEQPD